MPLTVPALASRSTRCSVSISSVDAGVGFTFALTPQQVETWSDQDLLDRIDAFKVGLMGFLPPGADVQVAVMWGRSAAETVLQTSETVPAPE